MEKNMVVLIVLIILLPATTIAYMTIFPMGASSTVISVQPNKTIVGSTGKNFTVNIDIADANETWAWQYNMTWDPSVLNITGMDEGEFLSQGIYDTSFNYSIAINYTQGWAFIGNTLLKEPTTYPNGTGTLALMNFTVLAEGSSDLTLQDTILIYKDGVTPCTHTTEDGQFVLLLGDINRDGIVEIKDLGLLGNAYNSNSTLPSPNWDAECDLDDDGDVDEDDLWILDDNYGNAG